MLKRHFVIFAVLLLAGCQACAQTVASFQWLGSPGNDSYGCGINSSGHAVGAYTVGWDDYYRPFLHDGTTMHSLGTFGGDRGNALGINDTGEVVGWAQYPDGITHAFLYRGAELIDVNPTGGVFSIANDINDLGQIVGSSAGVDGQERAFLYESGASTDLGTLGGSRSYAMAINNLGQIAGSALTSDWAQHACIWTNGQPVDLGTMGEERSMAQDINDSGWTVGYTFTTQAYALRAFLYDGVSMRDLGSLGTAERRETMALAINNSGFVTGYSFLDLGTQHAFLWNGTEMLDLSNLALSFVSPGSYLTEASAITDNGWIAGVGYNAAAYRLEAFRLQLAPVPEPSALLALLSGIGGLAAWRRRR